MNRTPVSLAAAALATASLAGCMLAPPAQNAPNIATHEMPYYAGQGVVIARTPAPAAAAPASAAAGASAAAPYRLAIRMADGKTQYVDTDNAEIGAGTRVELGADHTIRPL